MSRVNPQGHVEPKDESVRTPEESEETLPSAQVSVEQRSHADEILDDGSVFRPLPIVNPNVSRYRDKLSLEFEKIHRPPSIHNGSSTGQRWSDTTLRWSLQVDIHTYLDSSLFSSCWLTYRCCRNIQVMASCPKVVPAERQVYSTPSTTEGLEPLPALSGARFSFSIGVTMVKMIVNLANDSCIVGFGTAQMATGRKEPEKSLIHKDIMSIMENRSSELYLTHGTLRARVTTLNGSIWSPHYSLKIEVGSLDPEQLPEYLYRTNEIQKKLPLLSLKSAQASRQIQAMLAGLNAGSSCCVRIGNATGVRLVDPFVYIPKGKQRSLPRLVPPLSSEILQFYNLSGSTSLGIKGYISFRLDGTNTRLAIAFDIQDDDNYFEFGFLPEDAGFEPDTLCSRNGLSGYHYACGLAPGGEISASAWNVHVCAEMTNERNAALSVLLYTCEPTTLETHPPKPNPSLLHSAFQIGKAILFSK